MTVGSLQEVLEPVSQQLREFESYVRRVVRTNVPLLDLVLWYIFRRRGKRLRPALVFLSAAACDRLTERAFVGAALVELLHTATLLHDDVVDEAPQRRGMPSVNALWGNSVAVLVGDYLLARGLLLAMEHEEHEFLRITSDAVRRMSAAELRHLQLNRKLILDEAAYLEVVRGKTAALFAACCEIGAVSAGGEPEVQRALREFGEAIGIAFQLQDDMLDYVGRAGVLGKPAWQDLQEQKLTLPVLVALQRMPAAERREFIRSWKAAAKARAAMKPLAQAVLHYGGIDYTAALARDYVQRALEWLQHLPPSEARRALEGFAHFAVERTW
ncbi:MAG: polyprenyl synthetase family protein [Chlorobiota bacterium]